MAEAARGVVWRWARCKSRSTDPWRGFTAPMRGAILAFTAFFFCLTASCTCGTAVPGMNRRSPAEAAEQIARGATGVTFEVLGTGFEGSPGAMRLAADRARFLPTQGHGQRWLQLEAVSGVALQGRLEAAEVRVDLRRRRAWARDFRLRRAGFDLGGRVLEIDLHSGALDARDLRGALQLGPGGEPTAGPRRAGVSARRQGAAPRAQR